MNAPAPEPVASGPHRVTEVDGTEPRTLDDFVGDRRFTAERSGQRHVVVGSGRVSGSAVRFHQKSGPGGGKDVRVWRIIALPDGSFEAEPAATH